MELWAVTAGLGLAVCMGRFITTSANGHSRVEWASAPLLVAFLVTLIPFYQGTLQHLDRQWRKTGADTPPWWALLFDFSALFLQACLFFAMAQFLGSPESFATCLLLLLILDCLWALNFWLSTPSLYKGAPRWKWLLKSLVVFYGSIRSSSANARDDKGHAAKLAMAQYACQPNPRDDSRSARQRAAAEHY